jgi:hypothetical protein
MVRLVLLSLTFGATLLGQSSPPANSADEAAWAGVKALKTGQELRIYKHGTAQPVIAKMGDLTSESLIVILKDTQTAIARTSIEKIEARPPGGNRVTRETKSNPSGGPNSVNSQADRIDPGRQRNNGSYANSVTIGNKPGFEQVYPPKPGTN